MIPTVGAMLSAPDNSEMQAGFLDRIVDCDGGQHFCLFTGIAL